MTLDDTLFPFKDNLVVEGYSDFLILDAMSLFFERIKKNYLKPKISIVPVGTDKIPLFSIFFEKENITYAVLLDNDQEGRRVKKELLNEYGIEERVIIKLDDIAPDEMGRVDVEIEDLIDSSLYNRAVNEAYNKILERKEVGEVKIENLNASITKQTKKYVRFFRDKRLGGFNKIMVTKQIYNIISDKECTEKDVGEKTIENFDRLFQIINKKL